MSKKKCISELIHNNKSFFFLLFGRTKPTSEKEEKDQTQHEDGKYREFRETFKKYGKEFCSGSSLHGLRYVGAEGVSLFER